MGYFMILAAIPGFFLSSLIFMALWGVIAPNFGIDNDRLSHGYADNYHPLADGGTVSCGWSKRKKVTSLF